MRRPEPPLSLEDAKSIFLQACSDHDQRSAEAKSALVGLKNGALDAETAQPLRRVFHTLAGLLPMLGFRELGCICALGEGLLTRLAADPTLLPYIIQCHEELETGLHEERAALSAEAPPEPVQPAPTPVEPLAPQVLPPRAVEAAPGRGAPPVVEAQTVLVVDDDPAMVKVVAGLLKDEGFRVVSTSQATEAVSIVERERPQLTLLDVMMPSVDGFELCKRLRANATGRYMPIMFLSAAEGLEERVQGLSVGGDDYLRKPFAPAELIARVRSHLQRVAILREMSIRDALTRAYNRGYFDERLQEEVRRSQRTGMYFSLAMFDIDFFKKVNDQYGHQAGDAVLVQTAQLLGNQFRATDILSRYGGEEFALILVGAPVEAALMTVARACEHVARTQLTLSMPDKPEFTLNITLSGGVAALRHQESIASLIRRADNALYRAKKTGRNRVLADDSPNPDAPATPVPAAPVPEGRLPS